ncbi:MAG: universal stress protein [Acidobacteria bacterium]|nr:universal stress protein [Acidobacteriota bacterium]
MQRFENILFPIDFSDYCRAVAPAAAELAKRFHAGVTLFHALDMPSGAYLDWQAFLTMVEVPAIHRHAMGQLDHFLAREMAGVNTHYLLSDGAAAASIVECARTQGMDLIAMPTRGLGKFRALLLGSVTERVLHDSACPVWTEARREDDTTPPASDYRSILCSIDLLPSSVNVLRWAQRFALEYGAALRVVHATEDDWPEVRRFHQETHGKLAKQTNVEAPFEVLGGPVAGALEEAAQRQRADLLVIGRGHSQGHFGRLRTHAHQLIRQSVCPVLSV